MTQLERRQKILAGLDVSRCRGVEIDPLHAPIVSKRDGNVLYVDHTDADTLRRKYANNPTVDVSQIGPASLRTPAQATSDQWRGRTLQRFMALRVLR